MELKSKLVPAAVMVQLDGDAAVQNSAKWANSVEKLFLDRRAYR
jgi:hypothetical protein